MEESNNADKKEIINVAIRTTDGETIIGNTNIDIEERLSDLSTNADNPFIVLFNAEYRNGFTKVRSINKNNIVWIAPQGKRRVRTMELPPEGVDLEEVLVDLEKFLIEQALQRSMGSKEKAAALLSISRRSLRYRLEKVNAMEKRKI